jgi:MFS family permease
MASNDSISRHAWLLLAGFGVVMCICFGVTINAFGVYTLPLIETFGTSNEEANRAATMFFFTMSLSMPLSGWLMGRVAPRPMMSLGVLLSGLSLAVASQAGSLGVFVGAIGLCGLGIGLSTYIPAFTLVTYWVPLKRHGVAFGVLLAATSAGGIIFPPLLSQLSSSFGWRSTMLASAGLLLCLCVPLLLALARYPNADQAVPAHEVGETAGIGSALRSSSYWLWVLMLMLFGISGISVLMALVPYLVSAGFSAAQAANLNALTAVATLLGNLLFGAMSVRWGAKRCILLGAVLSTGGVMLLLGASSAGLGLPAVLAFCLVWGASFNVANQLSPTLLMESVGQRNFASLLGLGNLLSGLGSAFGPAGFGHLVDRSHSYAMPLTVCALLMAAARLPTLLLRPSPVSTVVPSS